MDINLTDYSSERDCRDSICKMDTPIEELKSSHEMTDEEKETLGIKGVDKNVVKSMDDEDQIKTADGEIPEFIATEPPLVVTDIRHKSGDSEIDLDVTSTSEK